MVHDPGNHPGKKPLENQPESLVAHKDFKWTNPEPGAFGHRLPLPPAIQPASIARMAAATGLLQRAIGRLDGINPQVAARMLTAFRSWKQLESQRRNQAEKALRELKRKQQAFKGCFRNP